MGQATRIGHCCGSDDVVSLFIISLFALRGALLSICLPSPMISSARTGPLTRSYTHQSPLPTIIETSSNEPFILGVDEAGRGPVLG